LSRGGWSYGSSNNADGTPRYFSPSGLTKGDPEGEAGCPRAWYYNYVLKIKKPQTKAQADGVEMHSQIENYLMTGKKDLGSLALSGAHYIPPPGPGLQVELDIGSGDLATAPVRARGIPLVGFVDLLNERGINYADEGAIHDPPGTIEVLDWKSTSSTKYIKSPQEMASTIQMTAYGKWVITTYPGVEWVRLSHAYFITKGKHAARKVSLRVHRDQVETQWNRIDKLAGLLIDVSKETNVDKVEANGNACDAYLGCYYASRCSYNNHNSLDLEELGWSPPKQLTENADMTLLEKLKSKGAAAAETTAAPNLDAEMKRLAKEEVLTRWPGLDGVIAELGRTGLGFPMLTGDAARAYATLTDITIKTDALAGSGDMAEFSFSDPQDLFEVLKEARAIASDEGADTNSLLPPDAPSADLIPAAATAPVAPVATATDAALEAAAEAPKKKAGRPKKEVAPTPAPTVSNVPSESGAEIAITAATAAALSEETAPAPSNFFVDCIPSSVAEPLWPVISQITASIAKKHGAEDIRCGSNDGPLGFGRWKGVLANSIRTLVTSGRLPTNDYTLDVGMSEIGQVVAEALREACRTTGGIFVKGTR
jgi:hypothetical protein